MTAQQDVLDTRRPKRRALGIVLLGILPLAVAGTAGVAASAYAPTPTETPVALPATVTASKPASTDLPPVIAPGDASAVDLERAVPQVTVSIPPPPEPEPVIAPLAPRASTGSTSSGSTSSGSTQPSSQQQQAPAAAQPAPQKAAPAPAPRQTADSYCSAPSSPYSAGGSPKGLLTAANKERARIGAGPLSWNGSLAAAATSWSQTLAGRDSAGDGSALAHNPNRPGAENVAVSGSTGGMSVGTAIARAHYGWMYSYGHCANIMNPGYSSMGAGAAATANGTAVYTTANYR